MSYALLDLEQGTLPWIEARYDYITATDVPILLRENPWKSYEALLIEKVNKTRETIDEATQGRFDKGHESEDTARNILRDYSFRPMVVTSIISPWLMASLDGFDIEKNIILEAKWTGNAKKLRDAIKGIISKDHLLQMQAQLIVTGANYCVYYITNGEKYSKQVVKPDTEIWPRIIEESRIFFDKIKELRNEVRTN